MQREKARKKTKPKNRGCNEEMADICEKCGLPKDICACEEIAKDLQKITITTIARQFGKRVTIVSGFDDEKIAKELGKVLKRALACGGTVKGTKIELQGEHKKKAKEILVKKGYNEGMIRA